jgi:hypothetical protein
MTANELADKLDLVRIELTIQASTMLRQQQAEIEALKLRELTDEEIEEVFQENIRQPNFMMLGDTQRFARAILKKASEK